MITRTWPYGTRKVIAIVSFERTNDSCVIACRHRDDPKEGTILLVSARDIAALTIRPKPGQLRVMEFKEGGPFGGHWTILDGLDLTRAEASA